MKKSLKYISFTLLIFLLLTSVIEASEYAISDESMTCAQILGPVLLKVVKGSVTIVQIVCAIIAIVKGMILLVPVIISKDADQMKKVSSTLVLLAIGLVLILLLRPEIRLVGKLLKFDTSCVL